MTEKPKRPAMSKARKLRIWERDGGVCYLCQTKVKAGEPWDAEHVTAWALTYDDSDDNIRVAHRREDCHGRKTRVDVATIAKAKRQGGETGQQARRAKREKPLIPSRPFDKSENKKPWPKGPSRWGKK